MNSECFSVFILSSFTYILCILLFFIWLYYKLRHVELASYLLVYIYIC